MAARSQWFAAIKKKTFLVSLFFTPISFCCIVSLQHDSIFVVRDNDEGPFEDDSNVFYILQYQKLPRMKKHRKAMVLADRARHGYF